MWETEAASSYRSISGSLGRTFALAQLSVSIDVLVKGFLGSNRFIGRLRYSRFLCGDMVLFYRVIFLSLKPDLFRRFFSILKPKIASKTPLVAVVWP